MGSNDSVVELELAFLQNGKKMRKSINTIDATTNVEFNSPDKMDTDTYGLFKCMPMLVNKRRTVAPNLDSNRREYHALVK